MEAAETYMYCAKLAINFLWVFICIYSTCGDSIHIDCHHVTLTVESAFPETRMCFLSSIPLVSD